MRQNAQLLSFFSLCLFVICSCAPNKTEVIQNYGTGEISRKYNVIDGKKEGVMTDYYPDGSIKMERIFRNDTQVDRTVIYYKGGKIKGVQYYDKGIREGGDSTFYEDGRVAQVVEYKDGIKHGFVRKWSKDGLLVYEARFERDSLIEVTIKPVQVDSLQKNK